MSEPLPAGRQQRSTARLPHHISAVAHLFFDEGASGQTPAEIRGQSRVMLACFGGGDLAAEAQVALQTCVPAVAKHRIGWRLLPALTDKALCELEALTGGEAAAPAEWRPESMRPVCATLVICLAWHELGQWATSYRVGRLVSLAAPKRLEVLVFSDAAVDGTPVPRPGPRRGETAVARCRDHCQILTRALVGGCPLTFTILPDANLVTGRVQRQQVLQRVADRVTADF
jgi:hypothetical protein